MYSNMDTTYLALLQHGLNKFAAQSLASTGAVNRRALQPTSQCLSPLIVHNVSVA